MTRFWHSCALDAKNAANMALQRHMVVDFPEFCGISHDPFQKWLEHLCVPYSGPHQSVLIAIAHNIGGFPWPHWPHWPHDCHTSRHFFRLVTLLGGVISCCTQRYSGEIWGVIQPTVLSHAACLKPGGEAWLHDWSVCKSFYTLRTHFKCFGNKSVDKMLKSVSKVCTSYCAHIFRVLLIEVIRMYLQSAQLGISVCTRM